MEGIMDILGKMAMLLGYVGEVGICAEDKKVRIGVCDGYYNFDIPFDKLLEIAEKVEEVKELNGKAKEA